jgi:hypothetical protein
MLASARRRSVKCLFVRLDTTNNVTMAKNKTLFYTEKILQKYRNYFGKTLDIKALVW